MCSPSRLSRRAFLQGAGAATTLLLLPGATERAWALLQSPDAVAAVIGLALAEARRAGADYADIRLVRTRTQSLYARNERMEYLGDDAGYGYGIRCLARGAWGFASGNDLSPEAMRRTARQAAEIAKASALVKKGAGVRLAPEPPHQGEYRTPRVKDPFSIPMDAKSALLLGACAAMRKLPEVKVASGSLAFYATDTHFASTEGARLHVDSLISDAGISATAVGAGDQQDRSLNLGAINAGWEWIEAGDLLGQAPRVAAEAKEKLSADAAPEGKRDLVLDPEHLHLVVHESAGHATELDRLLGFEADFAGTCWIDPKQVGSLKFGSKHVTIVADNLDPLGVASTGWDDDGVACQKWDIVRDGTLVGFSDNREIAALAGEARSHGSSRADGWGSIPIVRIANVGLAPGPDGVTPDDLIGDVQDGVYIEGTGTWSIDQRRLNMQFGGDMFYRIKNGKKAGMLKDVVYRAIAPKLWGSCDGVAGPKFHRGYGVLNCGKGQPEQTGRMTHAAAHARFRAVTVGKAKA